MLLMSRYTLVINGNIFYDLWLYIYLYFLNRSDDTPWNETEKIFEAIVSNDIDTVRSLLESVSVPVDPNCCTGVEHENMSPLHYAADRGYVNIAQLLVNKGANINAVDASGNTALMLAVICEHEVRFVIVIYIYVYIHIYVISFNVYRRLLVILWKWKLMLP